MLVYLITNLVNNKVYVGKTGRTLEERWLEHLESASREEWLLSKAIRKYGKDSFKITILEVVDGMAELNSREKFFIQQFKSFPPELGFGYNMTAGGDGFASALLSPEQRKAYGIRAKERYEKFSPEQKEAWKQRIKEWRSKLSPEQQASWRAASSTNTKRWHDSLSPEQKRALGDKISDAKNGRLSS